MRGKRRGERERGGSGRKVSRLFEGAGGRGDSMVAMAFSTAKMGDDADGGEPLVYPALRVVNNTVASAARLGSECACTVVAGAGYAHGPSIERRRGNMFGRNKQPRRVKECADRRTDDVVYFR